ncbi:MAG: prolyl oligopeptidase family serine peptidase [Acidimicrobiales bacterium]|nr:prolyl oligopeptidase family serine peptidase [Acidimicrobiales bacterium]
MIRRVLPLVLAVVLLAAACSEGGADEDGTDVSPDTAAEAATSTTVAATPDGLEAPTGAAFYQPPDPLPPGEPGEVIWAQPLPAPVEGSSAWKVLYHSRSIDGDDIAVSGVVVAPGGNPPTGGWPVVTWAHGTTGVADACAPSLDGTAEVPSVERLLEAGYVVAATDYEGLGTPGTHPYLVGVSEGRGVLDAARAAAELSTGAGTSTLIWGYSQGGHAAMWAAQLAPDYAPELDVLGVVGGAPPSDFTGFGPLMSIPSVAGFGAMIGYAWDATYPGTDLEALLTPEADALLPAMEEQCVAEIIDTFAGLPQTWAGDPFVTDPWPSLLAENSLGASPVEVPVLVTQGDQDAIVPFAFTEAYVQELCTQGADVQLNVYPGADHGQAFVDSLDDVLVWLDARAAGEPTAPTCGG